MKHLIHILLLTFSLGVVGSAFNLPNIDPDPAQENPKASSLPYAKATLDSAAIAEVNYNSKTKDSSAYFFYNAPIIYDVWSEKMFGRCCTEADLQFTEVISFIIVSNVEVSKYPVAHLSDANYTTTYVFKEYEKPRIDLFISRKPSNKQDYKTPWEVMDPRDTLLAPFKLSLINGYVKSAKTFAENGRVRHLSVLQNGMPRGTVELLDTPWIQEISLDFVVRLEDKITLIPQSFYSGTKYPDICISEIQTSLGHTGYKGINAKYSVKEREKGP